MKKHTKPTNEEATPPATDITEDVEEEEDKPFLNRDKDTTQPQEEPSDEESRKMAATQNKIMQKFFPAYFVAILADWLHGPYLYNVYEEKGYSHSQIGMLFTIGFASSGFFGIIAGKLVDMTGRRKGCIVFCVLYALNCLIIRSANLSLLALGRVISGVATSLLMSAFEGWLTSHCEEQLVSSKHQGRIFAFMGTLNSASAILAGVVANYLVLLAGYQGPFDGAAFILIGGLLWIVNIWEENKFASSQANIYDIAELCKKMYQSIETVRNNPSMVTLGLAQVVFETSMYIFVYVWVPALQNCDTSLNLSNGYIFAILMVFMTLGSQATTYHHANSVSSLAKRVVFIGSMGVVLFGISIFVSDCTLLLTMFCLFEFCCGIFFPTMGHLRSYIVPDGDKVTVINIFRTVLNINVIIFLLVGSSVAIKQVFVACLLLQAVVVSCGLRLMSQRPETQETASLSE
eukprot:gb/GECG01007684.1/.p1 GENE.gb/GECG01007684.1/~~gb/GECG01007684.1/.p1  ORF type:complete len:460 (+),score=52.56 gb/GECG01007684.1/:1-1380(+)